MKKRKSYIRIKSRILFSKPSSRMLTFRDFNKKLKPTWLHSGKKLIALKQSAMSIGTTVNTSEQ